MINAEKLTFGFSSTILFQDISFHLEENCHCALIGSNGTGKTTLVNLIREPDHYIFDGKLKRDGTGRIGYVSQFAIRDGDQSVTVYDYLRQDFLQSFYPDIAAIARQQRNFRSQANLHP